MKKVIIVHGWDGSPKKDWLPWLKRESEKRHFLVIAPRMPNPEYPKIRTWIGKLKKIANRPDKNTFFVGHSIGTQAILRYLQALPKRTKIGGAVFVGGWLTLKGLETAEEKRIAKPWLKIPINFRKIKGLGGKYIAIFSDNDYFVPLENRILFRKRLGAKIIMEHEKGHFIRQDGAIKLPSALKSLIKISKSIL